MHRLPGQSHQSARDVLLQTLPGRLFVIAVAIKLAVAAFRRVAPVPALLGALNGAATLALLAALGYFLVRLLVLVKRRLLWRVRRKLILSYVFIGFVPTLLFVAFFLFTGRVVSMNISSYLFKTGYDDLVDEIQRLARATLGELTRGSGGGAELLARRRTELADRFPDLSLALVQAGGVGQSEPAMPIAAGPWYHLDPPSSLPTWVLADGFAGTLAYVPADAPDEPQLVIRAVAVSRDALGPCAVIVDLPVDGEVVERLRDATSIRTRSITISAGESGVSPLRGRLQRATSRLVRRDQTQPVSLFSFDRSVAFLDYRDWGSGLTGGVYVSLEARLGDLYERISSEQALAAGTMSLGDVFLVFLVLVAGLFLIIEVVALVMGFALARSITSSVHELFMGTERVRQGDFAHRIKVKSSDQLGELAGSFNQMTASIEELLQQAAEKRRLEEELRIAREIQMSLLPPGPLRMPGLGVTAVCVPAREVGGDYYDFFPLDERRLGVLIADVAGKGTAAALYMAELKGLVLSLSQIHQSPRDLLIAVNRILAVTLDSRSFITMTYAVLDLQQRTMTYARAGHTPMIYLPGPPHGQREAQVLAPNGMVVGLRLEGVVEKFSELLEERALPVGPGDLFVLYTDGISEAMNADADLFGESRLSRLVEEHGHLESTELRERILREIQAFVGDADQHDDMTMILLKIEEGGVGAQPVREAEAVG